MKSLELDKGIKTEDNRIKDVRNLFRLKKETKDNTIKRIRNLFKLKRRKYSNHRQNIKGYYECFSTRRRLLQPSNFKNNSYIGYESIDDRNKKNYQSENTLIKLNHT